MFGLINMADYYCTFDKIHDILCQIKSILAVCFCILLIAKSGNETWCHDKYRLEGALCFPSPYTHKASVSSIYKPLHEWIWKKKTNTAKQGSDLRSYLWILSRAVFWKASWRVGKRERSHTVCMSIQCRIIFVKQPFSKKKITIKHSSYAVQYSTDKFSEPCLRAWIFPSCF